MPNLDRSIRDSNDAASSRLKTTVCYGRVCATFERKQFLSRQRIPDLETKSNLYFNVSWWTHLKKHNLHTFILLVQLQF